MHKRQLMLGLNDAVVERLYTKPSINWHLCMQILQHWAVFL